MTKEFEEWIRELCACAKEDDAFADTFIETIAKYEDIENELLYYAIHGDFLGQAEVAGYSVMDILVWQIDHFKSHMDRGEYDMQSNPERMVLKAFDTLLQMKVDKEPYVLAFQSESGTDYAEKY
jgi:hypothetical protein